MIDLDDDTVKIINKEQSRKENRDKHLIILAWLCVFAGIVLMVL